MDIFSFTPPWPPLPPGRKSVRGNSWLFKGRVSRDEYLFEGSKNQISTFCISADSFYNIWLPFCGEN
jgi:hypothetical protein